MSLMLKVYFVWTFQELSFCLHPPFFFFFLSWILLKEEISESRKLKVLLLYLPNKSKTDLEQISDINGHCVLSSLFTCSNQMLWFHEGSRQGFFAASFILVSQWSCSSSSLCDQSASFSLPTVPVARHAGRLSLNALNMSTQSVWHENYAFWSYCFSADGVIGKEVKWWQWIVLKCALGHGQSTSAKRLTCFGLGVMYICSLNSQDNSEAVLLTGGISDRILVHSILQSFMYCTW